jgi:hypothetical protein
VLKDWENAVTNGDNVNELYRRTIRSANEMHLFPSLISIRENVHSGGSSSRSQRYGDDYGHSSSRGRYSSGGGDSRSSSNRESSSRKSFGGFDQRRSSTYSPPPAPVLKPPAPPLYPPAPQLHPPTSSNKHGHGRTVVSSIQKPFVEDQRRHSYSGSESRYNDRSNSRSYDNNSRRNYDSRHDDSRKRGRNY